jgi:hypothetical protein
MAEKGHNERIKARRRRLNTEPAATPVPTEEFFARPTDHWHQSPPFHEGVKRTWPVIHDAIGQTAQSGAHALSSHSPQ